jgi:hypothetical protein
MYESKENSPKLVERVNFMKEVHTTNNTPLFLTCLKRAKM